MAKRNYGTWFAMQGAAGILTAIAIQGFAVVAINAPFLAFVSLWLLLWAAFAVSTSRLDESNYRDIFPPFISELPPPPWTNEGEEWPKHPDRR